MSTPERPAQRSTLSHRVTESTGIYQRTVTTARDSAAMEELLQRSSERRNRIYKTWLSESETVAQRILESKDAPQHIRKDAEEALGFVGAIRRCTQAGQIEAACFESFQLGIVYERIGVRQWEPHAARGLKTLRSAKEGHELVHGTAEDKARRWAAYVAHWQRVRQEKPHLSVTGTDTETAERFGVKPKTIQRARMRAKKN